jgi:hypothetical protein
MKKTVMLKILNPILGLLIINQAVTGSLGPKLPAWAFETLHIGGATLLVFLVIAHLTLNFNWIKTNYFAR